METYFGAINTVYDVLYIIEACRLNLLRRVTRRLSDKRRKAIRPGSVFVWRENEAGLKRWTDGKSWSPSRVHGSFLIYRECYPRAKIPELGMQLLANAVSQHCSSVLPYNEQFDAESIQIKHGHRGDYCFTPNGLYKKTISVETTLGDKFHVVYYYLEDDDPQYASMESLIPISSDPFFKSIAIPPIYPQVESPTVLLRVSNSSFTPMSCAFTHPCSNPIPSLPSPDHGLIVNGSEPCHDCYRSKSPDRKRRLVQISPQLSHRKVFIDKMKLRLSSLDTQRPKRSMRPSMDQEMLPISPPISPPIYNGQINPLADMYIPPIINFCIEKNWNPSMIENQACSLESNLHLKSQMLFGPSIASRSLDNYEYVEPSYSKKMSVSFLVS